MRNRTVFLDTSALLALVNSDDALHAAALQVRADLDRSGAMLLTTQWVLTEFLNHTAARNRRRVGVTTIQLLGRSERTILEPATSAAWRAAFDLYRRRLDKDWSPVDCTPILSCKSHAVTRVFTHDHHSRQAGFETPL